MEHIVLFKSPLYATVLVTNITMQIRYCHFAINNCINNLKHTVSCGWGQFSLLFFLKRADLVKKGRKPESLERSGESDNRSIRLVSCVLGDAGLQFFCSGNNSEWSTETDRENTFRGSGAETNTVAQGANVRHLQWDLAAEVVFLFWRKWGLSFILCSMLAAVVALLLQSAKLKTRSLTFVSL